MLCMYYKNWKGWTAMSEKLTVAIIGCGAFSKHFVELFKLHPHTEKVYVCDLVAERAKEFAEKLVEHIKKNEKEQDREDGSREEARNE